jgi:excisionase family DNA binding protein
MNTSARESMNTPRLAKRLLRTREAAHYLGMSAWQIRRLVQDGELPVVQHSDGGHFLLDVRDLDGYVERHKRVCPV